MTPAQIDHLKLIDAHLERLLDIAAKRTPGEWGMNQLTQMFFDGKTSSPPMAIQRSYVEDKQTFAEPFRGWCSYADATFIAAAAGNAEAGWRATRAAIAEILAAHSARYESWCLACQELNQDPGKLEDYPLPPWSEDILAAFPLELIQKP